MLLVVQMTKHECEPVTALLPLKYTVSVIVSCSVFCIFLTAGMEIKSNLT